MIDPTYTVFKKEEEKKNMKNKDFAKLTKAELIALLQENAQTVIDLQAEKKQAEEKAKQAEKKAEELTGLDSKRIAYEEKKFVESITCDYVFPELFTQDTVQYRTEHAKYLQELGRKYIQEVLQNENRPAGRQSKKAGRAGRPAGKTEGRAQTNTVNKDSNDIYRYIKATCKYEIVETDKYSTVKKEGKTVARIYVMKDNKVKFLIKEETAKKAGLAYTLMKFNLPASVIAGRPEQVDAIVKAF